MYKELEIKKRKVIDLQEDIKNKENFLASQNVFSSAIYILTLHQQEMIQSLSKDKAEWKVEKQGLILQKDAHL